LLCLSLFVSIQVYDAYVNALSIVVFFSLTFSFLDIISINGNVGEPHTEGKNCDK